MNTISKLIIAGSLGAVALVAPAHAKKDGRQPPVAELVAMFNSLDALCRHHNHDARGKRDLIYDPLAEHGFCYGNKQWEACSATCDLNGRCLARDNPDFYKQLEQIPLDFRHSLRA